jgi:hypothetical protein
MRPDTTALIGRRETLGEGCGHVRRQSACWQGLCSHATPLWCQPGCGTLRLGGRAQEWFACFFKRKQGIRNTKRLGGCSLPDRLIVHDYQKAAV